MRKLLLITLVAGGLVFASVPRSDAQMHFSVGFGPGYYGYYPSRDYYPYRYYRPYYGSYYRPNYWYGGHWDFRDSRAALTSLRVADGDSATDARAGRWGSMERSA